MSADATSTACRTQTRDQAMVNGTDVDVVEVSVAGANVIAPTIVKPHENVWVAIVRGDESLRTKGTVVSARAEIDAHSLRYHAGIAFTEDRPELLAASFPTSRTKPNQ